MQVCLRNLVLTTPSYKQSTRESLPAQLQVLVVMAPHLNAHHLIWSRKPLAEGCQLPVLTKTTRYEPASQSAIWAAACLALWVLYRLYSNEKKAVLASTLIFRCSMHKYQCSIICLPWQAYLALTLTLLATLILYMSHTILSAALMVLSLLQLLLITFGRT